MYGITNSRSTLNSARWIQLAFVLPRPSALIVLNKCLLIWLLSCEYRRNNDAFCRGCPRVASLCLLGNAPVQRHALVCFYATTVLECWFSVPSGRTRFPGTRGHGPHTPCYPVKQRYRVHGATDMHSGPPLPPRMDSIVTGFRNRRAEASPPGARRFGACLGLGGVVEAPE